MIAVFAHEHRGQFLADLHQIGQIGDVVLRNQVFHHADALQARARAQRFGHFAGLHACNVCNRRIRLWRIAHLEFHQQAAQIALVARQRAIEQQRAFGAIELKQTCERIDVFLHQGAVFLEGVVHPFAGHGEHREQVFGRVFGVFVEIEKDRALFIGAAPHAMPLHEFGMRKRFVASPELIAGAAAREKLAQALQNMHGPHHMPPRECEQTVEIAAHIELRALLGGQRQHELRTHHLQHRRALEARRSEQAFGQRGGESMGNTFGHRQNPQCARARAALSVTITQFRNFGKTVLENPHALHV